MYAALNILLRVFRFGNTGKRSEWVNFLRPGDQVQLVPRNPVQALHDWLQPSDENSNRVVYGISSFQRPLGSEPAVVCEWKLVSLDEE